MEHIKQTKGRLIWLNGKLVKDSEAKINVLSPTAQFGANVFEGIRCYWNENEHQLYAFRLEDHHRRLMRSMRLFGIEGAFNADDLRKSFMDAVMANGYREDIAVRQTVFVDGTGSWFSCTPAGMFVAPVIKRRKASLLHAGERVRVSSWARIDDGCLPPEVKVGANYINSRIALLEANKDGYDSALFLNRKGFVSEGCGSCFFMIKNRTIITPQLTDSILDSITRDTIIRIAKEDMKLEVSERSIGRTELYCCDEAFFCGSAVEISPVISIDGYEINGGLPGKLTIEIHQRYIEAVSGANKEYMGWITPVYD